MLTYFKKSYLNLSRLALTTIWIILCVEIFSIFLYIDNSFVDKFIFITLFKVTIIVIFLFIYFSLIETSTERVIKYTESNISKLQKQKKILKKGVAQEINNTFLNWKLTKTEVEICYLLLKGFSLVEICHIRGIAISTCKEHAKNIYKKANIKNRTELVAYFLEDFLDNASELIN